MGRRDNTVWEHDITSPTRQNHRRVNMFMDKTPLCASPTVTCNKYHRPICTSDLGYFRVVGAKPNTRSAKNYFFLVFRNSRLATDLRMGFCLVKLPGGFRSSGFVWCTNCTCLLYHTVLPASWSSADVYPCN